MSARIAPDPVGPVYGATADFNSRSLRAEVQATERPAVSNIQASSDASATTSAPAIETLPEMPPPAPPPGAAFATALISGQLSPKPTTEQEIQLRLGSAKPPAQASLPITNLLV